MKARYVALIGLGLLTSCFPRVNPYDPQCDPSQATCGEGDATANDATTTDANDAKLDAPAGAATIVVGYVFVLNSNGQDANGIIKAGQAGQRLGVFAKNTGVSSAKIIASLQNVPSTVTITGCTEDVSSSAITQQDQVGNCTPPNSGTNQADCVGACDCSATISQAAQVVAPGTLSCNPVLYISLDVSAADAGATIALPIVFTSTTSETWHDVVNVTVSP